MRAQGIMTQLRRKVYRAVFISMCFQFPNPLSKFLSNFISLKCSLPLNFAQVCVPSYPLLRTSLLWMNYIFVLMLFSLLMLWPPSPPPSLPIQETVSHAQSLMVRRVPKFSFCKLHLTLSPDCVGSVGNITSYHLNMYLHNILRHTLCSQQSKTAHNK